LALTGAGARARNCQLRLIVAHRLTASGTGFVVTEDFRGDGVRALPAVTIAKRLYDVWPGCELFIDACYSTGGLSEPTFQGHDADPLYIDAALVVTHWAEALVLERAVMGLGIETSA
tara:strand:- start:1898 stop:2248 length:351 start_codon:yes stop_codon:yes gene_type:complete